MSGQRKSFVGPGYMPKGGRGAAVRHNDAVRARAAASVAPAAAEPHTETVRTDVRASARSAWSSRDRIIVGGTAAAVSLVTSGLVVLVGR